MAGRGFQGTDTRDEGRFLSSRCRVATGFAVGNSGWRRGEREPRSTTPCGRCLWAAGTVADPIRRTRRRRGRPWPASRSPQLASILWPTPTSSRRPSRPRHRPHETIGTRAAVSGGCDDHVQDVVAARCAIAASYQPTRLGPRVLVTGGQVGMACRDQIWLRRSVGDRQAVVGRVICSSPAMAESR